jgi:membrane associated rhomboid family serine protease
LPERGDGQTLRRDTDLHADTLSRVATAAETRYCYRHPNRATGLSCTDCGRPICTDCATFAPVGIRCPDHSGKPQGIERVTSTARRASFDGTGALVTKGLIAVNVAVFLIGLAQGGSLNGVGGTLYEQGALFMRGVLPDGTLAGLAEGQWWRLITAAFLHQGIVHLAMNMFVLWLVGARLEESIGRGRYLLLYLVSGLAGSAGALLLSPNAITVGASGAIFGLLGALLVLERQGTYILGSSVLGLVLLNVVITFAVPNISIGGHLGGLVGGAAAILALSRFGRGHAIYGRPGVAGIAGVVAVGVLSVAIAWARVRGYAG